MAVGCGIETDVHDLRKVQWTVGCGWEGEMVPHAAAGRRWQRRGFKAGGGRGLRYNMQVLQAKAPRPCAYFTRLRTLHLGRMPDPQIWNHAQTLLSNAGLEPDMTTVRYPTHLNRLGGLHLGRRPVHNGLGHPVECLLLLSALGRQQHWGVLLRQLGLHLLLGACV